MAGSTTPAAQRLGRANKFQLEAFVPELILKLSDEHEKGTIKSFTACGNKILLALSTCALHVYTIEEHSNDSAQSPTRSVHPNFSTKPVQQMEILKEASYLITLADGIVSLFDSESLTLVERLDQSKGATTFSITSGVCETSNDVAPIMVSRLLVACRRRLLCYEWNDSEFIEFKEILMPDAIRTISFSGCNKAVCGFNSDYMVADIPSSTLLSFVPPSSKVTTLASMGLSYMGMGSRLHLPYSVSLSEQRVLLIKDSLCYVISDHGQLLDTPLIDWPSPPDTVVFVYPYIICIFPSHIEVRHPETFSILQTLAIPDVCFVDHGKRAFVATRHDVYRLQRSELKQQIYSLSEQKCGLSQAIKMLTFIDSAHMRDREILLRELQIKKGIKMFKKKKYVDALQLLSDISAPPHSVIDLYPAEISGNTSDFFYALEKGNETNTRRSSSSSQTRTLETNTTIVDPDEAKSPESHSASPASLSPPPDFLSLWTEKDLNSATRAVVHFLADTRRKISRLMVSKEPISYQGVELSDEIYGDLDEAAALVDTTLFKCYFLTNPNLIGPLLRLQNHCDSEVVRNILSHFCRWQELIEFFHAKRLHKESLELLHSLAISKTSPVHLQGPAQTVRYLQRLDNSSLDLIFDFASWPISLNESYGVNIFLSGSLQSDSLDRDKVLTYLQDSSPMLTIKYLEHIITEKNDESSNFHTALVIAYIQQLSSTSSDPQTFTKLIRFLNHTPSFYRVDQVFDRLPQSTTSKLILEIKAILCGRRGQHREALHIFAFELRDALKAKTYCSDLYEADSKAGRAALHTLMAMYLSPPSKKEKQQIDLALDLLASQGSRMSVVEIISTLPDTTRLQDIIVFLMSQVRELETIWKKTEIETSLRKVDLIKTQEALLNLRQRSVTISNINSCRVCFKRLGNSVLTVFPDGVSIHYGCTRAYQSMLEEKAREVDELKKRSLKTKK